MADIRRLDGSAVDTGKLERNDNVARVLAEFTRRNEAGRVFAVAVIGLTPEGWYSAGWDWPSNKNGFPWSMALEGALSRLQAEIAATAISGPLMQEPMPEPPDGA